jgi:GntR family transcriptional regulator/MocR family aminotransferase
MSRRSAEQIDYEGTCMVKRAPGQPLAVAPLDRAAADPLHRQLYERLRAAITAGNLAVGARLPSTRALAVELGVTRGTVLNAMDQLLAEGYVTGAPGSGTYVAGVPPEEGGESSREAANWRSGR